MRNSWSWRPDSSFRFLIPSSLHHRMKCPSRERCEYSVACVTLFSRSAKYSSSAWSGSIGSRLIDRLHADPRQNHRFETADFGRLTPQRSIRSTIEPEPAAPIVFDGHNRPIARGLLVERPGWFQPGFVYSQTGRKRENQSPIDTVPSYSVRTRVLNTEGRPCLDAVQIVRHGLCPKNELAERRTHRRILFHQ